MARAKRKKAPPRVGRGKAKKTAKKRSKKASKRTPPRKRGGKTLASILRKAAKEKRPTRFRYDRDGNIIGVYVPLKHQTKAEQKKATRAMVAACSAGAYRQGSTPRSSCGYRTTRGEAGTGLAYTRWGFPKGYKKPKHVTNPMYSVAGLQVKTFKDDDGDWGFAVYSPMGEPLAIGSGEPSQKTAAREGKAEARFQSEILAAEGEAPSGVGEPVGIEAMFPEENPSILNPPRKTTKRKSTKKISVRKLVSQAMK